MFIPAQFNLAVGAKPPIELLVAGLRGDGIWTKFDRLWVYAQRTTTLALRDIVGGNVATIIGSPAFVANRGYTGTAVNPAVNYIDTGFNAFSSGVAWTQDSAHISVWCVTNNAAAVGGALMGNDSVTGHLYVTYQDGLIYAALNTGSAAASIAAPATRIGHWILSRTSTTAVELYQNGVTNTTYSNTSLNGANRNYLVCATNTGTVIADGSPNQIAMASIGAGLTDAEAVLFYNRVRAYMTAVGVP
jgi:hypothetical protein